MKMSKVISRPSFPRSSSQQFEWTATVYDLVHRFPNPMLSRPTVNTLNLHERINRDFYQQSGRFPHDVITEEDINPELRFLLSLVRADRLAVLVDNQELWAVRPYSIYVSHNHHRQKCTLFGWGERHASVRIVEAKKPIAITRCRATYTSPSRGAANGERSAAARTQFLTTPIFEWDYR
jgi:hypothetical protein